MFRKSSIVLALFAVALIAGCSGPQPTWRKEGTTAEGAHSALAQCRYDIGMNQVPEEKQRALIKDCMEAKGFRWR